MKTPEPVLEQPKSEKIAGLIVETETQQTALESELSVLNREHDRLAGAEELDTEALESLRARSATIVAEKDTLSRRLSALKAKKGDAEHEEAGQRLQHIAAEVEHLVEGEKPALEAYAQAARTLLERAEAIATLHDQESELRQEMVYLLEAFGLPRPVLSSLGDCPNIDVLTTELGILFSPLRNSGPSSPWSRKRQELRNHPEQRQHQRAEAAPVQAHNPGERPVPRTMLPVRPDHEEDHKPNKLQSLLRGQ